MTQRIVVSERFGGFGLSETALTRLRELGWDGKDDAYDIDRADPRLVRVVDEMGDDASDRFSTLVVVEVPDGVSWHISEYDGYEVVHEDHRTWASYGERDSCG